MKPASWGDIIIAGSVIVGIIIFGRMVYGLVPLIIMARGPMNPFGN